MFYKFEKLIVKIEKIIITVLLAIMFLAVIMQVVARYFYLPIIDTTEMSVMIMSLITFIGAGLAIYTKDHICVEITNLFKSKRLKFIFELFVSIFMMIFICVFLYLGYFLLDYALQSGETTLELRLPLYIPYVTMIIGLILMLVHTISNLIILFRNGHQTINKSN